MMHIRIPDCEIFGELRVLTEVLCRGRTGSPFRRPLAVGVATLAADAAGGAEKNECRQQESPELPRADNDEATDA